ncbi:protein-cysteine N-palmitoyltransferase Rasp isoform X1 [Odontomachus brunneus]|uniref:protein-cysteine N-palmitoyltransferase Rasp isoform X1 n=2 Tax=Odontomachus brunneus TaxID=486640 RepID=UPI0013F23405|nr:protein-cysteine N-palmitoyltransferase Rasp isoform X1 [Odontomachus brunneus]XP_032672276.1 protein-cysteine N-palmitoyltransferase Rasp isoform X1 [Odontomachus brunneus]XP_032672277.1 protein-cysteine N-palmitoyltransferase Rasp isoform X1 [Odontomachus brunneus]
MTMNKYENYFYFLAWPCAIVYSAYQFYSSSNYFDNYYDAYGDFDSGWTWISRKKDISDQEWRIWLMLLSRLVPCTFIHHFVSRIIKINNNNNMILYCWYILASAMFLYYYLGILGFLCILLQPVFLHILTCMCTKNIAWCIHVFCLFIIHVLKTPDGTFQSWLRFSDEEHFILTLTMCWIHLRIISHNMDNIDEQLSGINKFIQRLAYCLYLPTLFLGPLILYHEFVESVNQPYQYWNYRKLQTFALNFIRYMFWIYFTEFLLHFLYINAIQYHPQVVQDLNSWALYGLGYCMGQFFLNKYVVVYGICGTLCELDDIKAPPKPKCIGRIHLYSDMWKHFDRGFYTFLVRYIYLPIQKSHVCFGKLFASFLCFSFVLIWHGIQMNIFIWTLLNFIGVVIESVGVSIGKSTQYRKIQNMYLSTMNTRRFHCILASPLLAMSAISNFYFFGGQEIGNIFVHNILYGSWKVLFVLLSFLYCCCQLSVHIKNWELQRVKG